MKVIRNILISIIVVILPIMLGFSVIRGVSGQSPIISSNVFYDYLMTMPVEEIDNLKYEFGELQNIGFSDETKFNPNWEGNFFEDIAEIGKMIADFFTAIWDYLYFMTKVSLILTTLSLKIIVWALTFPIYIIRY